MTSSGFINLNKPLNWTSHDCVARTRRLLQTKKVGHGGTLDPLATGVLPIAIGRATKLIQYLPSKKAYRAVIRFGITTTTDDLEGDILTQQSAAHLSRSLVKAQLAQFVGNISQRPPMYSAVQVQGKRLYDLARKGKAVEVPIREVTIHRLDLEAWTGKDPAGEDQVSTINNMENQHPELTLAVDCGPGTYIRSLARDLGEAVGTGATLVGLTRTHSNGFDINDSISLEGLEKAIAAGEFEPVNVGKTMAHLEEIRLASPLARRWCMGQKLALLSSPDGDLSPDISGSGTRFSKAADSSLTPSLSPLLSPPLRILNAQTQAFLGIGEIRWLPPFNPDAVAQEADADSRSGLEAESLEPDIQPTILEPILAAKKVFAAVD